MGVSQHLVHELRQVQRGYRTVDGCHVIGQVFDLDS